MSQRSQYSTHIRGEILDLVFDFSNSNIVSDLPWPYTDHLVLSFQIWGRDVTGIALSAVPALCSVLCNYGHFKCLLKIELNEKQIDTIISKNLK